MIKSGLVLFLISWATFLYERVYLLIDNKQTWLMSHIFQDKGNIHNAHAMLSNITNSSDHNLYHAWDLSTSNRRLRLKDYKIMLSQIVNCWLANVPWNVLAMYSSHKLGSLYFRYTKNRDIGNTCSYCIRYYSKLY